MNLGTPSLQSETSVAGCDTEFLSRHSTKVLIQEASTRRYLSGNGLWTAELNQAMSFRSGSAAIEHLNQRKLTNVRLVLSRDITVREIISVSDLLRT